MRPKEKAGEADRAKAAFAHADGDHLTMLNAYYAYLNKGRDANWCFQVKKTTTTGSNSAQNNGIGVCFWRNLMRDFAELSQFEEPQVGRQRSRAAAANDGRAV